MTEEAKPKAAEYCPVNGWNNCPCGGTGKWAYCQFWQTGSHKLSISYASNPYPTDKQLQEEADAERAREEAFGTKRRDERR